MWWRLEFIDISAPGFQPQNYGISLDDFMFQMHAIDRSGRVYRGSMPSGYLAGVSGSSWYDLALRNSRSDRLHACHTEFAR
jgi:hypothetical protein